MMVSVGMLGVNAAIMGASSNAFVVAGVGASFGLAITMWNVVAVSLRQRLTPDELRGRVAAAARLLAWGTQPLGALLGGLIADGFGLRAPFFFAAGTWAVMLLMVSRIIGNRQIEALTAETAPS